MSAASGPARAARPSPVGPSLAAVSTARLKRALFATDDLLHQILRADEPLLEVEQELVRILTEEWEGRFPEALKAALDAIKSGAYDAMLESGDIAPILDAVRPILLEGWAKTIEQPISSGIGDAYTLGRERVLKPLDEDIAWNLTDEHAQKVLASDTMYWVGNAWDNNLGGQIGGVIQKQVIEQGLGRKEAGEALHSIFEETFPGRSRAYWNVVAAAGVVRSRTFGSIGSFEQAEVETFRFRNPDDDRTTDTCHHLNNRIFTVSAAVAQRDRFLAADSPEDAKDAHPWPKPEHVVKMDTAQLQAAGIIMPPLHGECRSSIIPEKFAGESSDEGRAERAFKPDQPRGPDGKFTSGGAAAGGGGSGGGGTTVAAGAEDEGHEAPKWAAKLKAPSSRHLLSRLKASDTTKKKNTIVMPGIDVAGDMKAIRSRAIKPSSGPRGSQEFTVNGRVYRATPSPSGGDPRHTYPLRGEGFHTLNRNEYNALKVYKAHGGETDAARAAIASIPLAARARALHIWTEAFGKK